MASDPSRSALPPLASPAERHAQMVMEPAYAILTDEQRQAVNVVWDTHVVAALEEAEEARREVDQVKLGAQDARDSARFWRDQAEAAKAALLEASWA